MSPVETITEATILQGTAKGLQKAAKEAQAHKAIRSPEDAERELRVAGLLIDVSRKFAEGVLSVWDKTRGFIRAGEVGDKDLNTLEQIFKRLFALGKSIFGSVRGLLHHLQSQSVKPSGVAEFEKDALRLAAAHEAFADCFADLKDPRLQESIRKGFEEAMRTTGEPWDWKQELFGGEGR
jgi:hypothetical protein